MTQARDLLTPWRRHTAGGRGRALLVTLALVVFGWQLALQGHVLGHDLAAVDGPCAYALQVNQLTPLSGEAPCLVEGSARHVAPESTPPPTVIDRAPLVRRARGPPALLA